MQVPDRGLWTWQPWLFVILVQDVGFSAEYRRRTPIKQFEPDFSVPTMSRTHFIDPKTWFELRSPQEMGPLSRCPITNIWTCSGNSKYPIRLLTSMM